MKVVIEKLENVTVYRMKTELFITGLPEDETHNCDFMGCSSIEHVLYRFALPKKPMKCWIVVFRDIQTHEVIGPAWPHERTTKPTQWAKKACYWHCQYAIKECRERRENIADSELQGLQWYTKEGKLVS